MSPHDRGQAGVTLVELMISVVISGIVISAALAMGFSMMNGFRDHRQLMMVERSARVSVEMMADSARAATPGVETGVVFDGLGCVPNAGINVINSTNGPDVLEIIHGLGGVLSSTREDIVPGTLTFHVLDGRGFTQGDYMLIVSYAGAGMIIEIGQIVPAPTGQEPNRHLVTMRAIPPGCPPMPDLPAGSLAIRARFSRYFIQNDADVQNKPTLMLDPDANGPQPPEPIAEGIEDLQVAVGIDLDGDGDISEDGTAADEWFFNAPGDPAPLPGAVWRALRITIVARTTHEITNNAIYSPPTVEDHTPNATNDEFRRRTLTTTVDMRNLVGSP